MTSSAVIVITPAIITTVSTVTSVLRKRRSRGRAGLVLLRSLPHVTCHAAHPPREFRIGPDPAPRLDKALGRDVPEQAALSRSRLARLIEEGAVAVNGAVVTDPRATPVEGDAVAITVEEAAEVDTWPRRSRWRSCTRMPT
jgi:hypothetical protein